MLSVGHPAAAGLLLLVTTIFLVISWNLTLHSAIVSLIYISGLLVLLLFVTGLMSNLKQSYTWNWCLLFLLAPVVILPLQGWSAFAFRTLLGPGWGGVTIRVLLFLVVVLILITLIFNHRGALRRL